MLRDWKKNKELIKTTFIKVRKKVLTLVLVFTSISSFALPDIPSLMDCEDIIFNSGFQNDSDPSNGSSGSYPGYYTRTVFAGGSPRNYYISIPPNYDPNIAIPLLFSWHGAGGVDTATINALNTRDFWKTTSDAHNFIIIAQTGNGSSGGFQFPNDITLISIILNDMYNAYNIEKKRVYGHGFSAGGHLIHTLMLFYNNYRFPAYAISAGNFVDAQFEDPNVPANSTVVPVYVSVGSFDPMLATIQSERIKFLNAGWIENETYWLDIFSGGHQLDPQVPEKSWDKLCTFTK